MAPRRSVEPRPDLRFRYRLLAITEPAVASQMASLASPGAGRAPRSLAPLISSDRPEPFWGDRNNSVLGVRRGSTVCPPRASGLGSRTGGAVSNAWSTPKQRSGRTPRPGGTQGDELEQPF
jgi:hypothetical protein